MSSRVERRSGKLTSGVNGLRTTPQPVLHAARTGREVEIDGSLSEPVEYLEANRSAWERWARDYVVPARKAWTDKELCWGIWDRPESELLLLESLPPGSDIIELGCGAAAISAWLARAGMRSVGVDFSRAQIATAERLQGELGPSFPLVHANAEQVPYDVASFDAVVSEYGASLWCDPERWVPEASRLLRPNGRLIFLTNSALLMACTPPDGTIPSNRLVRDYFGEARLEFMDDEAIEFHLTHSEWIRVLRASGFVVERLVEVRPPPRAVPRRPFVIVEWARRWPSEEIWVARKAR